MKGAECLLIRLDNNGVSGMITLAFLAALAAIFATVLAMEVTDGDGVRLHRPAGLIHWLTGGNWPAKIGGALMIVGVGALLRYALINIELPPQVKLGAGVFLALALGFASTFVPEGPAKRPVSLALGGAAFGVAYLTAYSAFGLFHYLSNPVGLALLGITSAAAGVYAVTRGAQSLAVLSMIGAFLAPAFSISDPGPQVLYGYYAGASLLTLVMVTLRGWRPLIHLSFLFTLAGGLFFAWTSKYYEPDHAAVMLPMLLLLVAIHVAMPICENRGGLRRWVERLDVAYLLALPIVSAVLALAIAPNRMYLSTELIALAAIWAVASAVLAALRRNGTAAHAVIAAALILLGIAARFRDLPWELIGLALAVGALWVASLRRPLGRIHDVLAGVAVLFGALHILGSLANPSTAATFDPGPLIERIIAAALLIAAGAICRRIRQALDTLLLAVGILWAFFAVGAELVRLELAALSLVVHWFFLLVAGSLWIPGRKVRFADQNVVVLTLLILATAVWSALHASELASWISMAGASVALIGMALRPLGEADEDPQGERFGAALMAPVVTAIWAFRAGTLAGLPQVTFFSLACGAAVALIILAVARLIKDERASWLENTANVFATGFAVVLAGATLLYIVRDPFAVTLELLCAAGLALHTVIRRQLGQSVELQASVCMIGIALLIQANLMRMLGPVGTMNIGDVLALEWSAIVSLLWAVVGCVLTIWSRKVLSRVLWICGATLLVGAAVKLLLFDFGSLGQLANILAVIAAGAVFLLVGWLAPMPPSRPHSASDEPDVRPAAPTRTPRVSSQPSGSSSAMAHDAPRPVNPWMVAGVITAGAILAFHGSHFLGSYRRLAHARVERLQAPAAPPPVAAADLPIAAPVVPDAKRTSEVASEPPPATAVVPEPPAAASPAASDPGTYKRPPIVDEHGVRTYSDYTYERPAHDEEIQSSPSSRPPPIPREKEEGIDQLVREGRLRPATASDVSRWRAATGSTRVPDFRAAGYGYNEPIPRYYVVVREMTYPDGLYGAHAVTFIIPRGVPRPFGKPGHSTVLEVP